jgi:hypothetical protein
MAVDMSPEAITRRLREASRLGDLRPPFPPRVDMSAAGIERRLREVAALHALAHQLRGPGVPSPPGEEVPGTGH